MAIFSLPPPPSVGALDSPEWKRWFYLLTKAFKDIVFGISDGGTGLSTIGTPNQVLGVDGAGTALEYKTIAAGTNVTVVDGPNSITISSTGGITHQQVLTRVSFRM